MSGSFRKIDYSVRPAKYAERRMLRDIFRRVTPFAHPEDYTYVGFGSVWFADFTLFHRALGVRDMVSIESSLGAKDRVRDNAPFRIRLDFDRSSKALKRLDWSRHQFLWLDYDDQISPDILRDVRYVAENARSGTLLAVTVKADAAREFDKASTDTALDALPAIERFRETFSTAQLPANVAEEDLTGLPFAILSRAMIATEIGSGLDVRTRRRPDAFSFAPICSIDYADGAEMTTIIGMLHADADQVLFDACRFDELSFVDVLGATIRIEVPLLTVREVRALEGQLPSDGSPPQLGTIPQREADKFARLYRYLPSYAVLEN